MSAIAPATRSRGNSSRMIPNASGKIAPPSPWIVRAMIITGSEVGERGEQAAGGQPGERHDEHALLPEHVAEPPGDRRHDRGGEQVGREHPGNARGVRVQVLLEHGQRRHDERLEQGVGAAGEREHGQDQVRPDRVRGACGRGVARHGALAHLGQTTRRARGRRGRLRRSRRSTRRRTRSGSPRAAGPDRRCRRSRSRRRRPCRRRPGRRPCAGRSATGRRRR